MNSKLLIICSLLINCSMHAAMIRVLPVTLFQGEWYGLFAHESKEPDLNKGWTDFKGLKDDTRNNEEQAIDIVNKQTNYTLAITQEYFQKWVVGVELEKSLLYVIKFQLPKDYTLDKIQETLILLTPKQFQYDLYAFIPINKIINNKKISLSLRRKEDIIAGREIALMINNAQINDDIKNILQLNWSKIRPEIIKLDWKNKGISSELPIEAKKPTSTKPMVKSPIERELMRLKSSLNDLYNALPTLSYPEYEPEIYKKKEMKELEEPEEEESRGWLSLFQWAGQFQ